MMLVFKLLGTLTLSHSIGQLQKRSATNCSLISAKLVGAFWRLSRRFSYQRKVSFSFAPVVCHEQQNDIAQRGKSILFWNTTIKTRIVYTFHRSRVLCDRFWAGANICGGIYWKEMPEYAQMNKLDNNNTLPDFFWTAQTKMNCLKHAIGQSLDEAYAHHIQRLMIIGNFALLAQIHPDEVDAWYLGVYIDALEWVEITNTRGMSQFADGGIVATKPYVSSANYINKMGNYCKDCAYSHTKKVGEGACPFNALYWNFLDDKKEHFKSNQRMGMMLNLLKKKDPKELSALKERASQVIKDPDSF